MIDNDTKTTSVEFRDPSASLAQTLAATAEGIKGERITLRELLARAGEQGLLLLCMLLCVPFLLPVTPPGISTVFSLVIVLIGVGVVLNRVPWLPGWLMDRGFKTKDLVPALEKSARLFARMDRFVRPRLLALTHGPTINRFNGLVLIFAAVLLMAPFGFIPFSNTLPTVAILLLAAGMLQRDGLFVVGGYVTTLATLAYFGALVVGALLAGQGLSGMM